MSFCIRTFLVRSEVLVAVVVGRICGAIGLADRRTGGFVSMSLKGRGLRASQQILGTDGCVSLDFVSVVDATSIATE